MFSVIMACRRVYLLSAGMVLCLSITEARAQQLRQGQKLAPPVVQNSLPKAPNVATSTTVVGQSTEIVDQGKP